LSTHHFARAFHQSVGMPPHSYVLSRRLERAEHMLRETQLPLSEIAAATGFSDQSHLARHFRRRTGMSPRLARWKERYTLSHNPQPGFRPAHAKAVLLLTGTCSPTRTGYPESPQ